MRAFLVAVVSALLFLSRVAPEGTAANGITLPTWTYTIAAARDGLAYSGVMVGSNPYSEPDVTTTIPTQIIPLIIRMPNDGIVFDPTAFDDCVGAPVLARFLESPIFQNYPFTINGVDVGTTQYLDALQRANFWAVIGGRSYHTLLDPATLPAVTIDVPPGYGVGFRNVLGQRCGYGGLIEEVDWFVDVLTNTVIPSLSSQGVSPATFPIFLLESVRLKDVGSYHAVSGPQTYAVATFDTTWPNRCYSGTIIGCPPDAIRHSDVADITPVLADWLNDPFGTNQTPSWGWDSCRADVDVFDMGDNHLPVMPNAFWYHIPQVPFFSWFFGGPPLCAGGVFSSLGRYRGHARLCPPGGTNPAVLGDSDADGSADLVWRNIENGDLAIISPGFQSPGVPLEWQVEGVDDLDAQGSSDLVWRSTRTGDVAAWLVIDRVSRGVVSGNPSAWITQAALVATGVPLTWDIVGVRDLDGDSKADLIWRHTEAGHVAVWLMDGPHVRTTPVVAAGVSLAWQIADIADLDGDRKGDIVWREMVSGDVAVWLMDGGAVRSAPIIGAGVPLTWELIAAGDLDGDGKADLIWHNGVTGDVAAWLMNGLTVKASAIVASGALGSWQIVKVLDYDGDGKVDLLWRNSETGLYSAWLMDGFIIKRHESVFPFFGPSSRLE